MKKEKKSHFNLWIYIIITGCILSSSIAYSALNASVKITGDVVIEKPKNILYEKIKENAVMDNIRSTYVSSSTGINFKENSSDTNGKGVYERAGTENQQYPIYYYRGAVDNNNVIFANYCWKIVRTTETGGVKLIFNGTPSSSNTCNNTGEATQLTTKAFNSSYDSPIYVGYRYGTVYSTVYHETKSTLSGILFASSVSYSEGTYTLNSTSDTLDNTHHYSCGGETSCSSVRFYVYTYHDNDNDIDFYGYITLSKGEKIEDVLDKMFNSNTINQNDSTIKNYIENEWYKTYMTNYTDQLEDTVWCYDRSIYDKGGWYPQGNLASYLHFGGYGRVANGTPSLECPRELDKFTVENGRLQYKVGLLTADEVLLAGARNSNNSYYLYTGKDFFLGTPQDHTRNDGRGAHMFMVSSNGSLGWSRVENLSGLRPVVSLKAGTNYNGGDGKPGSPYIVNRSINGEGEW